MVARVGTQLGIMQTVLMRSRVYWEDMAFLFFAFIGLLWSLRGTFGGNVRRTEPCSCFMAGEMDWCKIVVRGRVGE